MVKKYEVGTQKISLDVNSSMIGLFKITKTYPPLFSRPVTEQGVLGRMKQQPKCTQGSSGNQKIFAHSEEGVAVDLEVQIMRFIVCRH